MVRVSVGSGLFRLAALVAMLMMALVPASGSAVAQGEAQSFTSPLTGQVIQTTGSWVIDTASVDSSPDGEIILLYGEYDGMMVAYLPAGTNLDMARDLFLQEFAAVFDTFNQIDRGAYGNVSYSLDIASTEGVEFGVFSLFLGQRASGFVEYYLYFSPVAFFQPGMAAAQANVTVGGSPVFDGVDPAGLQNLLNANAGSTGGSTEAPSTNVVQDEVQQDVPAPTQAPPPADAPQPTAPPQTDQGPASNDGAIYAELLEAELTYLDGTIVDFITNFANLQEGGTDAVDQINRIAGEWQAYPGVAAGIPAPPGYEDIHADYLALADDVALLADAWYTVVAALQGNGDVDVALDGFSAQLSTVQTQTVQLRGALDEKIGTPQTEAPQPTESVQPTQAPEPTDEPDEEEVVDLTGGDTPRTDDIGNETETGQGSDQVDLAAFEDLGLVAEDMWVSPQHGTEITWGEGWMFDASAGDAIYSDTATGHDAFVLYYEDAAGAVGLLYVDVVTSDGFMPEQVAEVWSSDEFLQENEADLLTVDANRQGTSAAVVTREFIQDGTELYVLREISCLDDACETVVLSQLIAQHTTFADVYAAARGEIELDGSRLFAVLSLRDAANLGD